MMKYLVNRETKEHQIAYEIAASSMERYPGFAQDWKLVEAESEGWIPWEGGECPLPDECKCQIELQDGERPLPEPSRRWAWARNIGEFTIAAYRPILSETAEKVENHCSEAVTKAINDGILRRFEEARTVKFEKQSSVFDRLKSAIAASESIPAIIAEIDAMLPDGYCVVQSVQPPTLDLQPAEDMSDWKKWSTGDLLECVRPKQGYLTLKGHYTMADREYGCVCVDKDDSGDEGVFDHDRFRFHSRPAKGSV